MSKYAVTIIKSAEKELSKLPVQEIVIIRNAVTNLANEPRPPGCKKLKGFKDLYEYGPVITASYIASRILC